MIEMTRTMMSKMITVQAAPRSVEAQMRPIDESGSAQGTARADAEPSRRHKNNRPIRRARENGVPMRVIIIWRANATRV